MGKLIGAVITGLVAFIGLVLVAVIIGALIAFPVMWLWNGCLVGLVAGIAPIHSFWQALGLFVLTSLLFKSSK